MAKKKIPLPVKAPDVQQLVHALPDKIIHDVAAKLPVAVVKAIQTIPNGTSAQDYNGCIAWSGRRWAWEFLRRNLEFQLLCEVARINDTEDDIGRAIAAQFGLRRFKSWFSMYEEESMPRFVNRITSYPKIITFGERNLQNPNCTWTFEKKVKSSEVLVRFDIAPMLLAPKTVLQAQLASAERQLIKYLEAYPRSPGLTESKKPKTKKSLKAAQLCKYLRAYDMWVCGATTDKICVAIRGESRDRHNTAKRAKSGSELRNAAIQWVDEDYLLLAELEIE